MGSTRTWAVVVCCAWLGIGAAMAERVTIGAEDDWAPYSSAKAGQSEPEGLTPLLVKAAFKTQGIDADFEVMPFARCLFMAEKGRIVGCFNTTRTQANQALYHWHPTPLFQEEIGIFGRSDKAPSKPLTQKNLEGKTVGVTVGYTYGTDFMTDTRINKLSAASDSNLLKMLDAGRVDYILLNTMPGYWRLRHEKPLANKVQRVGAIGIDSFWLSFSKVHPDGARLTQVFEKGLRTIKSNGQYAHITQTWKRATQH